MEAKGELMADTKSDKMSSCSIELSRAKHVFDERMRAMRGAVNELLLLVDDADHVESYFAAVRDQMEAAQAKLEEAIVNGEPRSVILKLEEAFDASCSMGSDDVHS